MVSDRQASSGSDQSQGIQQLVASRDVMARYLWTQLHSSPADLTGETAATVWGSINVPMQAVVASYRKTIRTLRERRESLLLAQALHELALLFVSRGGQEGQDEAVKLWMDAVDAAAGLLSALEVRVCASPPPDAQWNVLARCAHSRVAECSCDMCPHISLPSTSHPFLFFPVSCEPLAPLSLPSRSSLAPLSLPSHSPSSLCCCSPPH